MAKSKLTEYNKNEILLADIAKAIAHPARIKILEILTGCDQCITGSIVEKLPLAQSTVSQHLKELKRANLIAGEVEGPKTCYCINKEGMTKAKNAFGELFSTICKC